MKNISALLLKGGSGSGNYDGPGRPRFNRDSTIEESREESINDFGFPPTSDDPAPGKEYFYHATSIKNLDSISQKGLVPPNKWTMISVAPHLESAAYWSNAASGGNMSDNILLRIKRKYVRQRQHDQNDPFDCYDPNDKTSETGTYFPLSANKLEVYKKNKWESIVKNEEKKSLSEVILEKSIKEYSMKTIWDVIFKGGPGSGRKPTGRKSNAPSAKLDRSKYRTLNATGRVNMAAKFLNEYKPNYIVKANQDKSTSKLSGYKKKKWQDHNKNIGELEGRRKAMINRGNAAKGKERRKNFLMAISCQESAQTISQARGAL